MLGNWIKQGVSGAPGTGNITLVAAAAGFKAFSEDLVDDQSCYYEVRDGINREKGYGHLTSSGATLVRDNVIETEVSGTSTKGQGLTKVSLTGAAVVYIAASAASMSFGVPSHDPVGAGIEGVSNGLVGVEAFGSSFSVADNAVSLSPFLLKKPILASSITVDLLTAPAVTERHIGLYYMDLNNDNKPGNVAIEADFSAASTGVNTISITNKFLPAGLYVQAFYQDGATSTNYAPVAAIFDQSPWGFYDSTFLRKRYISQVGSLPSSSGLPDLSGATFSGNNNNIIPLLIIGEA